MYQEFAYLDNAASQSHILEIISFRAYEKFPRWLPHFPVPMFLQHVAREYHSIAWHSNYKTVYPHSLQYRMLRAITTNDIAQVKKVLNNQKFDVNCTIDFKYSYNALQYASLINRFSIMQLLLLHGANINKGDQYGNTPLIIAVNNNSLEAINTLMKNGCNRHLANIYQYTALDKVKGKQNLKHIEQFILKYPQTQRKFPKFRVKLDIENKIKLPILNYFKKYKIYQTKPKLFPFNNFKGCYRIDLTSFQTIQQILQQK